MIGPGTLEHLRAASPYNIVRLILPEPETGPAARDADLPWAFRADPRVVGQLAAALLPTRTSPISPRWTKPGPRCS